MRDQNAVERKCTLYVEINSELKQRWWDLTRHPDVHHDSLLPVLHSTDLRKIYIQGQETCTAEETQCSHGNGIVTGILVAVEDAVLLHLLRAVDIALVSNTSQDNDGEELEARRRQLGQC